MSQVRFYRFASSRLPQTRSGNEMPNLSVTDIAAFGDSEKDNTLGSPCPGVVSSSLFSKYNHDQPGGIAGDEALHIANVLKPMYPVTLEHSQQAEVAIKSFISHFKGRPIYAVKANDSAPLLRLLWDNGITWFEVASIGEVRHVSRVLPEAKFPGTKCA